VIVAVSSCEVRNLIVITLKVCLLSKDVFETLGRFAFSPCSSFFATFVRVLFETSVEVHFKSFVPYYAYVCSSPCLFFFCFGVFLRKRRVVVSVFSRFKMFVLPLAVVFLETLGLFFFSSRSSFVYFLHVEFGVSVYIFQPRFVLLGVVSFYSSFRFRFC
jgi:hypothetical protein